jgi:hypothetical protein
MVIMVVSYGYSMISPCYEIRFVRKIEAKEENARGILQGY